MQISARGRYGLTTMVDENVWEKINAGICTIVESITLEELGESYKTLNRNLSPMFYI